MRPVRMNAFFVSVNTEPSKTSQVLKTCEVFVQGGDVLAETFPSTGSGNDAAAFPQNDARLDDVRLWRQRIRSDELQEHFHAGVSH